jgi:hypothetical protein
MAHDSHRFDFDRRRLATPSNHFRKRAFQSQENDRDCVSKSAAAGRR